LQAQEVTTIAWARGGGTLAAATAKGNLQLFQLHKRRRVPIVGKHTKRVPCAAWNGEGLLVLGAADKTVIRPVHRGACLASGTQAQGGVVVFPPSTLVADGQTPRPFDTSQQVSLTDGDTGDTLKVWQIKGDPLEIAAAEPRADSSAVAAGGGGWSALTNARIVYVFSGGGPAGGSSGGGAAGSSNRGATAGLGPPLELSFQDKYGAPQRHLWFGDGQVMVGFKGGRVVVVSSARWAGRFGAWEV
jgi:WD repeat-containing protein 19